mmetsp:Transcript_34742/g.70948  ORF Transcript_34742/g.70948 Transcript_34742/m.70948 type:complete len:366 (-) Transcript_34742:70-1167(-)
MLASQAPLASLPTAFLVAPLMPLVFPFCLATHFASFKILFFAVPPPFTASSFPSLPHTLLLLSSTNPSSLVQAIAQTAMTSSFFLSYASFSSSIAFSVTASISFATRNASSFETPSSFPSFPFFTTSCAALRILLILCLAASAAFPSCFTRLSLVSMLTFGIGTSTVPPVSSIRGLNPIPESLTASRTAPAVSGSKQLSKARVGPCMTTWATELRGARVPYARTGIESNSSGVGSDPRTERKDSDVAETTRSIRDLTSSGDGRDGGGGASPSSPSPSKSCSNFVSDASASRWRSSLSDPPRFAAAAAGGAASSSSAAPPLFRSFLPFLFDLRSLASSLSPRCACSSRLWRCLPILPPLRFEKDLV